MQATYHNDEARSEVKIPGPVNPGKLASIERKHGHCDTHFPPLEAVIRPTVPTSEAAFYLNRKPQTLREWAMTGKVIKPIRCNGRLAWPVSEIKRVLGVA